MTTAMTPTTKRNPTKAPNPSVASASIRTPSGGGGGGGVAHVDDRHRDLDDVSLVWRHRAHHRVRGPEIRRELREDRMDGIRTRGKERGRHEDPEENHESPASPPTERRGPRPAHGSTCSPENITFANRLCSSFPGIADSCRRVSAL